MSRLRLKALHYFDAAARHRSFKAAATELGVTPAAISHQIKALESDLDCPLFERGAREVTLTEAGRRLREATEPSFLHLEEAIHAVRTHVARKSISVLLGPFISGRWLAPRLGRFLSANPRVDVEFRHSTTARLSPRDDVHLAILFGDGDWPGYAAEPLLAVETTPVCIPAVCPETLEMLKDATGSGPTLIHYKDREDWREWLIEAGCPVHWADRGIVLDDPNVAIDTAAAGNGVALGAFPLIEPEIASRRLAEPFPRRVKSRQGYYIVRHRNAGGDPNVAVFLEWLRTLR